MINLRYPTSSIDKMFVKFKQNCSHIEANRYVSTGYKIIIIIELIYNISPSLIDLVEQIIYHNKIFNYKRNSDSCLAEVAFVSGDPFNNDLGVCCSYNIPPTFQATGVYKPENFVKFFPKIYPLTPVIIFVKMGF